MIRRPPRSTRTDTLSLHDALPIYQPQPDEDGYGRQQVVEVRPQVALALAGIRRLQVHYLAHARVNRGDVQRSEEHTSELQSLMRISYAVFCLKKNTQQEPQRPPNLHT